MKLTECRTGREVVLRCKVGGAVPAALLRPGEHPLVRSAHDGSLSVEHDGGRLDLHPLDRASDLDASDLADPLAVSLLQFEPAEQDAWLVLARRFAHRVRFAEPVVLVVPTVVQEQLKGATRSDLTAWAQREFSCEGHLFAFCGGRPFDHGAFELLGRTQRLQVQRRGERLVVTRVGKVTTRGGGVLMEADLELRGEQGLAVEEAADGVVEQAEAGSSWVDVWASYQAAERKVVEEEANSRGRLGYVRCAPTADGFCFTLAQGAPAVWRQQELRLSLDAQDARGGSAVQVGELRPGGVQGREVRVHLPVVEFEPPPTGTLGVDLRGDRTRWERRDRALATLRGNDAELPDLGDVLEGRGRTATVGKPLPELSGEILRRLEFDLTVSQREAIRVALNTPDIALIQGPPGTGKTLIIQLIAQRLHESGRRPVLLCAFQHDAVLRVLEDIDVGGLPVPRVGGRRGEGVEERTRTVREWLDDLGATVDAALADPRLASPWTALREQVARLVSAWRRAPGERPQALALLREVERQVGPHLPPEELQRLRVAMEALHPAAGPVRDPAVDWSEVLREAGRQRLEPAAWSDDGPERARRLERAVKRLLGSVGDEALRGELALHHAALVRAAAQHRRAGVPDGLEPTVAALRALAAPPAAEAEQPEFVGVLERTVNGLLSWLDERRRVTGEGSADALRRFLDRLRGDPMVAEDVLRTYADALGSSILQAVSSTMADLHTAFDTVIVDEAARANPLDLLVVLVLARRVILVGDHLQLPHVLEPRLERAVTQGRSEDAARLLRESLFARTWELYREGPPGDISRVVPLLTQFRMHPVIGSFISDAFYGGGLQNGSRAENLGLTTTLTEGKPIAWFDVQGEPEERNSCYRRPHEAEVLAERVGRLLRDEPPERSIGVISFYQEQVRLLEQIAQERGWGVRVRVGTVDAFQGREFDFVLLSCVRSGGGVGFLALPNRLNVAMSRGKRLLAVFADHRTVTTIPQLGEFHRRCREGGFHASA